MPEVTITKELGSAIKEIRTSNKVKSKDISAAIKKSPTYISKLENGEIQKIDIKNLMTIFHTIFPNDRTFGNKFEEFIGKCTIKFSAEEQKREIWIQNFDTVLRKIPIPPALIDYCNQQIEIAKISISEIVARINLNEDISDKLLDFSKYNKNQWYWEKEEPFAIMDISLEEIEKILNKQIIVSNYITMEALVYNILKFLIPDFKQAHEKTINVLTNYKFYSIVEKNKRLATTKSVEERNEILTDFDKVNSKLKYNINKNLERFSDLNIKYTNEKLIALSNSFDADPSLAIAYLGIDISSLKDLNTEMKRNFLLEISELVKKYQDQIPKNDSIVLL